MRPSPSHSFLFPFPYLNTNDRILTEFVNARALYSIRKHKLPVNRAEIA